MSGKQGYAAETDPPAGARPARDTGVSPMAVQKIARLTRERDEARADAIRARVARDEARQERDAARQERDEAVRSQEFAEAEEAVMFRKAAALQRERNEARAADGAPHRGARGAHALLAPEDPLDARAVAGNLPMSPDFGLGLLLGIAGTLLYLLPWIHRLDKELDEAAARYSEMLEAAAETFDLPPDLGRKARR